MAKKDGKKEDYYSFEYDADIELDSSGSGERLYGTVSVEAVWNDSAKKYNVDFHVSVSGNYDQADLAHETDFYYEVLDQFQSDMASNGVAADLLEEDF